MVLLAAPGPKIGGPLVFAFVLISCCNCTVASTVSPKAKQHKIVAKERVAPGAALSSYAFISEASHSTLKALGLTRKDLSRSCYTIPVKKGRRLDQAMLFVNETVKVGRMSINLDGILDMKFEPRLLEIRKGTGIALIVLGLNGYSLSVPLLFLSYSRESKILRVYCTKRHALMLGRQWGKVRQILQIDRYCGDTLFEIPLSRDSQERKAEFEALWNSLQYSNSRKEKLSIFKQISEKRKKKPLPIAEDPREVLGEIYKKMAISNRQAGRVTTVYELGR